MTESDIVVQNREDLSLGVWSVKISPLLYVLALEKLPISYPRLKII